MYDERASAKHYILVAAWLLLGLALGLRFPDVDHRLPWLVHRSILTHGMMASILLLWLTQRHRGASPALRFFAVGFSLSLAVHLCFDFFPRGWSGFALIHVPVYGRTTASFSQAWLALSIVSSLYIGFLLVRKVAELMLGLGILITSFAVSAVENGRAVLMSLMLLALATAAMLALARQARKTAARRAS